MSLRLHIQTALFRLNRHRFHPQPLSHYVNMLTADTLFSFSRFGDGEWNAIIGTQGKNCDGHPFYPELGRGLAETIINPKSYVYALQPLALKHMRHSIEAFENSHACRPRWENADVFHDANKCGTLLPLVNALRKKSVILVGPAHLKTIESTLFPIAGFIEIPPKNCFEAKDSITAAVAAHAENRSGYVYAFSASMTTNLIIHDLFDTVGRKNWMIDFGSLWDVYAGVKSRDVYEKLDWATLIEKNTGKPSTAT